MPEAPLRILFVSPGRLAGAHLPFVQREAAALRAAGHRVEVFCFDNASYRPDRLLRHALALRAAIRELRPDVVHAQFGKFNALVAGIARIGFQSPLVITFRGTDINRNNKYSLARSALGLLASQAAAFLARGLVCVSREIRAKVWADRPAIVVPTGVDTKVFRPFDQSLSRDKLGLPKDQRIVLFNAGKNPAVKDPELAAAAVAEAEKAIGKVRFLVLDGTAAPDDIPLYMNAADCLLVTSRTEGSPTVVQEAMACNLPVVSVDVGDVRERLEGVSRCAVVARDARALGAALAAVLRDPRRSDGRVHAAALSVEAIAARLVAFYRLVGVKHGYLGAKYGAAG